ncbi:MAG: hypothetical protein Q8P24_17660 [Desulfobacterales bacterium]|nr:hypothetical protein [Desulfobacterales bacterium]
MKHEWKYFWAGVICTIGFNMSYQDFMGLEKYIDKVRSGWLNVSPLIGIVIMILPLLWCFFNKKHRAHGDATVREDSIK